MVVLVTGANGFLGHYLVEKLLEKDHTVIATGKGECRLSVSHPLFRYISMDFTDPFNVHDVFADCKPEVVVHAGAMSKPDECENDQWRAYVTNVESTITLLVNAEEYKSFFIFLSTDFIFDGKTGMYKEDDAPGPVNFYGKTKVEAEEAVKEYGFDWAIVRTVLVYGDPKGAKGNLLTLIQDKLEKGESYSVFDDQVRTPTYVGDLADGIARIVDKKAKGIYHLSGKDMMSPYEMAVRAAEYLGLDPSNIKKIHEGDLVQPAKRPAKTGFDISKARQGLDYEPISFEEGLKRTFING